MANLSLSSGAGSYYSYARNQQVFAAYAKVTAPVIYTTAAGTGGPLLWNPPNSGVLAVLLGVTCAVTVVTTVAAALGITGHNAQPSAPTTTTAIDGVGNCSVGGPSPVCTAYRVGTVATAGSFFLPLAGLSTGALTVDNFASGFIDLGGIIVVPSGSWASLAASATASTTVAQLGLLWAEASA